MISRVMRPGALTGRARYQDGKGPELTPFNVGLTIIGFN